MSLPHLIGNVLQISFSKHLGNSPNRKTFIWLLAFLQGAPLIAFVILLALKIKVSFYIILSVLIFYYVSGNILGPVWSSFIGDVVPEFMRGRFFGKRNRLCGIVTFTSVFLGGYILHFSRKYWSEANGFLILFLIGFIARGISSLYLYKSVDPAASRLKTENIINQNTIKNILINPKYSSYRNFILFIGLINFSIYFSGPYFAVYMLKQLKLNYIEFTIVSMAVTIMQLLTLSWWGKVSDHFGNYRFIIFCASGIILSPILWLFSGSLFYLILIQCYAGFVWAGFSLCSLNYVFDALAPDDRPAGFPLYHFCAGIAIFVGSYTGGIAAQFFESHPEHFLVTFFGGYSFRPLFFISGILRFIFIVLLFNKFKELKLKSPTNPFALFFRFSKFRPILGSAIELISSYWKKK